MWFPILVGPGNGGKSIYFNVDRFLEVMQYQNRETIQMHYRYAPTRLKEELRKDPRYHALFR